MMRPSKNCMRFVLVILPVVCTSCSTNTWTYAPGFTEQKFSKIRVGMTQAEVRKMLGKPLSVSRTEDRLYRVKLASGRVSEEIISYNQRGIVVEAHGYVAGKRHLPPAITRAQAEGFLHCSVSKRVGVRYRWDYAATHMPLAVQEVRAVEFGYDRRVKRIMNSRDLAPDLSEHDP